MNGFDYDQRPEPEPGEVEELGRTVYESGVLNALKAVLIAIEGGATVADIKTICERGVAAFTKEDE